MPDPDASPRTHWITDVVVLVSCSCGEVVDGSTELAALSDWEAHCAETPPDEW
jgi:hypothetical protein